jgi:ABC-type xylose transport system permease subunit
MRNLMKCKLIGYGFLVLVTIIETILLGILVGVTQNLPAAYLCMGAFLMIFNGSIWIYAMNYLRTKRALEHR